MTTGCYSCKTFQSKCLYVTETFLPYVRGGTFFLFKMIFFFFFRSILIQSSYKECVESCPALENLGVWRWWNALTKDEDTHSDQGRRDREAIKKISPEMWVNIWRKCQFCSKAEAHRMFVMLVLAARERHYSEEEWQTACGGEGSNLWEVIFCLFSDPETAAHNRS